MFVDDCIDCAVEGLGADPDRVAVTGMSAGGLFTSRLSRALSTTLVAAAPFSGGFFLPYEEEAGERGIPLFYSWGGETDMAVEQDFNGLALEALAQFEARGQMHVACNHGEGHTWPPVLTGWALDFLLEAGAGEHPWAQGLPAGMPGYCTLGAASP